MKAHELAKKLLEGPDVEVCLWYDAQHIPLRESEIEMVTERSLPSDPDPPYILFL